MFDDNFNFDEEDKAFIQEHHIDEEDWEQFAGALNDGLSLADILTIAESLNRSVTSLFDPDTVIVIYLSIDNLDADSYVQEDYEAEQEDNLLADSSYADKPFYELTPAEMADYLKGYVSDRLDEFVTLPSGQLVRVLN